MIDHVLQNGLAQAGGFIAATPVLASINDWLRDIIFRPSEHRNEVANTSDDLYLLIFWIGTFFFVLLMVLMVVFTIKYRRRPGVAPERSAGHNTALELTWTIVPLIILAFFFFKGFWGYMDHVVAPGNATELVVTARKWNWEVAYPNGARSPVATRARTMERPDGSVAASSGPIDVPVFVVAAGRPYKLRMYSQDVLHSFWIPDFRVKFDVFPNRYTTLWFQANKEDTGDHWVFCAEYCGDNHSEMAAIIRVVSPDEYDRTIAEWASPKGPPHKIGEILYTSRGCNACHTVDGGNSVGPTWLNLYGYEQTHTDGTTAVADEQYLSESIRVPGAKVVQGYLPQMPPYQGVLTDTEIEALIAYIRTLSDRAPADAPAAGDSPADPLEPEPGEQPAAPAGPGQTPPESE